MLSLTLIVLLSAPNVIVISADTLRADYLGCYGFEAPTSPNLDALAAQSLLFEDAVCEVPLTGPSFGAMLSSQFPRSTGTVRNGLRMPDSVPLITEQFKAAGYSTFCVQSNWTLKDKLSGLARGFDTYDDAFYKKRWGFIKSERNADEVTEVALRLLNDWDKSTPLFAWIHYSDPHAPYKRHRDRDPLQSSGKRLSKHERVRANYASEVAHMDHFIGILLKALPTENTYIMFVGDHGESLYEHNYLGHGRRIEQTGMHIPLFVSGPGVAPGRSKAPARGIDVGPTLLALAGMAAPETMRGLSLVAQDLPLDRPRVVETYGGAVPKLPGAKAIMASAGPQFQGVLANGYKLIRNGSETKLYNLVEDPGELNDLSPQHPDRAATLSAIIDEWTSSHPRGEGTDADLDKDDLEALDSLGYVE